jgi:hypothetical protein
MKFLKFIFILVIYDLCNCANAQTYFNIRIHRVSLNPNELLLGTVYLTHSFDYHSTYKTLHSINSAYVPKESSSINPYAITQIKAYTRYKKYKKASMYESGNTMYCYSTNIIQQYENRYDNIIYESVRYPWMYPYLPMNFVSNSIAENPNILITK